MEGVKLGLAGLFDAAETSRADAEGAAAKVKEDAEAEAAEIRRAAQAERAALKTEARAVRPGEYWSPRHRMPFDSRDEGSKCVG